MITISDMYCKMHIFHLKRSPTRKLGSEKDIASGRVELDVPLKTRVKVLFGPTRYNSALKKSRNWCLKISNTAEIAYRVAILSQGNLPYIWTYSIKILSIFSFTLLVPGYTPYNWFYPITGFPINNIWCIFEIQLKHTVYYTISSLASVLSPVPWDGPGTRCPGCPGPPGERRISRFGIFLARGSEYLVMRHIDS